MTSAQPDIAALLGSRICHDLISPLGAISNGVELLALTGEAKGPELELISESVENANARIRYFRVAYGAASPDQSMSASEIGSILGDLTGSMRLKVAWRPESDIPRDQAKLAFLMLQCLETAMPWGGAIEVTRQNSRWSFAAKSDRMKIGVELWDVLSRGNAERQVAASEVQFLLLPAELKAAGRSLSLVFGENTIDAQF